jgi:hypothetical protein
MASKIQNDTYLNDYIKSYIYEKTFKYEKLNIENTKNYDQQQLTQGYELLQKIQSCKEININTKFKYEKYFTQNLQTLNNSELKDIITINKHITKLLNQEDYTYNILQTITEKEKHENIYQQIALDMIETQKIKFTQYKYTPSEIFSKQMPNEYIVTIKYLNTILKDETINESIQTLNN